MNRAIPIGLAATALGALLWGLWCPSDERRIRNRLDALADAASIDATEPPVARMARAVQIGRYFTEDVRIDVGAPYASIHGRDTVVALASRIEAPPEGTKFKFVDVAVAVDPEAGTANVNATATGSAVDPTTRDRIVEARELELTFQQVGDEWLIARVMGVSPIERPK